MGRFSKLWVIGRVGFSWGIFLRYTAGICVGAAYVFEMWESASLVTLLNVFSLWCVNYGAVETWLNFPVMDSYGFPSSSWDVTLDVTWCHMMSRFYSYFAWKKHVGNGTSFLRGQSWTPPSPRSAQHERMPSDPDAGPNPNGPKNAIVCQQPGVRLDHDAAYYWWHSRKRTGEFFCCSQAEQSGTEVAQCDVSLESQGGWESGRLRSRWGRHTGNP